MTSELIVEVVVIQARSIGLLQRLAPRCLVGYFWCKNSITPRARRIDLGCRAPFITRRPHNTVDEGDPQPRVSHNRVLDPFTFVLDNLGELIARYFEVSWHRSTRRILCPRRCHSCDPQAMGIENAHGPALAIESEMRFSRNIQRVRILIGCLRVRDYGRELHSPVLLRQNCRGRTVSVVEGRNRRRARSHEACAACGRQGNADRSLPRRPDSHFLICILRDTRCHAPSI